MVTERNFDEARSDFRKELQARIARLKRELATKDSQIAELREALLGWRDCDIHELEERLEGMETALTRRNETSCKRCQRLKDQRDTIARLEGE